jgi:protein phosphatase
MGRLHRLLCTGATDVGRARKHNEDYFGLFPELGLFVVADGMGGAAAGEVAAKMAVDLVVEAFVDPDVTRPTTDTRLPTTEQALLVSAIERANRLIHGAAQSNPGWKGMGSTIAAALVCSERAALAHVGDSRVYRLRGRRLDLLTEDHSLLNEFVGMGLVDPEHPEEFEYRNVITRCLGAAPDVEVDARWVEVVPGDTFLLCSDGLTGVAKPAELQAILSGHPELDAAATRLVQRANELGGPDNITAVLVRVG